MSDSQNDPVNTVTVTLDKEPVELYKVLKFEGLVASGAEAKIVIDEGEVRVNGEIEYRRRRKIYRDMLIEFQDLRLVTVLPE